MKLRWYQQEAVDAIKHHLKTTNSNPCACLPTGGGKSLVIADLIREWATTYPNMRIMVLAHRKELVEQNSLEFRGICPSVPYGIYAAGLKRWETYRQVTFASIDSIYNKAEYLPEHLAIIVDEAHAIPPSGDGKYRRFLSDMKAKNPRMRVIGLTATPFRLSSGPICHDDYILNALVYSAPIERLIDEGFLSRVYSRIGECPDTQNVRKNGRGDYVTSSLAEAVDIPEVVTSAVGEADRVIKQKNRKTIIVFCVNLQHCEHTRDAFRALGYRSEMVTGKTPDSQRYRFVEEFRAGQIDVLCNVNVFCEGFNVKHVDCVVLLRPTLSRGLYSQMVGRGLRIHPDKQDCYVLDFGGNIERHGPIDNDDPGEIPVHTCHKCGCAFATMLGVCPECGEPVPKRDKQAAEEVKRVEKERDLHDRMIADASILGSDPQVLRVDDVEVFRHQKLGGEDTMRVEYRCGLKVYREWVDFTQESARQWWSSRFITPTPTIDGISDGLGAELNRMTKEIVIVKTGKRFEIKDYVLEGK